MGLATTITLKFNGTAVAKGLASIKKGFASLNAGAGKMLGSLASSAMKLTAVLGPLASFAGMAKLGMDAIGAASDMETLQTQFGALLKSESKSVDLISKLRAMNIESPLGLMDFAAGAKQLLGVRMSADEAADALDKLSNISMGNADNFDSLVRAFSQTKSAGRLMGQEVLQYVNAGFNPLNEISVMTGESMARLKKRMEDGKITFEEVALAINHATSAGGLFNGMNKKVAETTEGKIQKLKDSWSQLLIAFGTPLTNHLKPMIDELTASMGTMTNTFKGWGEATGKFGTALVNAFRNGDLWNFVKDGFMAAASLAGEKLVAAFIYGGTIISNAVKDGLRGTDLGIFGTITPSANVPMSWQSASETARNAFNSEDYRNSFKKTIERNQEQRVPLTKVTPEETASIMAGVRELMAKQLEELKGVNRRLQPQP